VLFVPPLLVRLAHLRFLAPVLVRRFVMFPLPVVELFPTVVLGRFFGRRLTSCCHRMRFTFRRCVPNVRMALHVVGQPRMCLGEGGS
jgi:hypothetical protein